MKSIISILLITSVASANLTESDGVFRYWPLLYDYGSQYTGAANAFMSSQPTSQSSAYNPALLAYSSKYDIGASHQGFTFGDKDGPDDFMHGYSGFSTSMENWGWGIGYRYWVYERGESNESKTTSLHIGLGYKFSEKFSAGLTMHKLNQDYPDPWGLIYSGEDPANDYAMTIGVAARPLLNRPGSAWTNLAFGLSLRNLGRVSKEMTDYYYNTVNPTTLPQRFHFGVSNSFTMNSFTVRVGADFEKDLVALFPSMDWDGDFQIGGYTEDGNVGQMWDDYNSEGQVETAHFDNWYSSILTSWYDDAKPNGDWDRDGDRLIGGYNSEGVFVGIGEGEYSSYGSREVGASDPASYKDELQSITRRLGISIDYKGIVSTQLGTVTRKDRSIEHITFGISVGPKFLKYHYSRVGSLFEPTYSGLHQYHAIQLIISGT